MAAQSSKPKRNPECAESLTSGQSFVGEESERTRMGNKRLKVVIQSHLDRYISCKTKIEKTLVVSSICDTIREASQCGGFVKLDTKSGQYIEVGGKTRCETIRCHCNVYSSLTFGIFAMQQMQRQGKRSGNSCEK